MEKLIWSCNDYSIKSVDSTHIYELAEFVVKENYFHHSLTEIPADTEHETTELYKEELSFMPSYQCIMVYDSESRIIGSIRVCKWNRRTLLPMQKIFNISPLEKIEAYTSSTTFWHIGRFAIKSDIGTPTIILFKQLMVLAVAPIVNEGNGYMLAETDAHLLRVMNALGIETWQLGKSEVYLSSETVPIYSTHQGLSRFYNKYRHLVS